VAFVIASPGFRGVAAAQKGQHYTNFELHAAQQEAGEFPFTPPVHAMFALREAIAETLEEGVAERQAHYADLAARTLDGLAAVGIEPLLKRSAYGHTLVASHLPNGWSYEALHDPLKAKGYCIYAAQGDLKKTAFRIGLIGHFGADAVDGLFREMRVLLKP
jgi:2-aminoethylphosphonate-pyruvate transaminase